MFKRILIGFILLFSLVGVTSAQDALAVSKVTILTAENYQEFIKNDIRIVEFYSEPCDSLTIMENNFSQIAQENDEIQYGKMDVNANRDFVISLRYRILPEKPTVIFFLDGELSNGFVGYATEQRLSDIIASIVQQKKMKEALAAGEINFMDAYDFTLPTLAGRETTLSQIDGLIILDFWATWCPPCKEEIPYLQEFHKQYNDKGLTIIGISSEPAVTQREFRAKQYENGKAIDYTLLVDTEGEVAKKYGIRSIPTTYFISPEGELITKETGFANEMVEEYKRIIKENLPE